MRFTLRQLQVFVAVAQQESVSRAAGLLALSQSAASTSITELERQTSCQLFDRAGKRLSLNALGRQLLPQAVALLDQAKEIEDLLNGKSGFGSLTVGATLTIGNYLATLLIGSFMQQHPESQVKLVVQNTAHIVQQVAHYEIDLGLIEGDCAHPISRCRAGSRMNWWCFAPRSIHWQPVVTPHWKSSPVKPGSCVNRARARA
jgi:DNA-binding transcriptional LysR family regulator